MFKYIVAVLCPPAAMALCRKPIQTTIATAVLLTAVASGSIWIGVVLLAALMIWACHTVGEAEAEQEIGGFMRSFSRPKV